MVRQLAKHAPELAPDLDFLLLTRPGLPGALSHAANVREQAVSAAPNGPAGMWLLPLVADLSGVDLFHAPSNVLPAGLPMPCVTTVHDLMWLDAPELCAPGPLGRFEAAFYRHGIRRALRRSAIVSAVSHATGQAIAAQMPNHAGRIAVTMPGVSVEFRAVPPDRAVIAELGLDPARRFILTVGQNAPYKNHVGALRAFARAFADRPEFDHVFVQRRGRRGGELLSLAAELGLAGRVVVLERPVSREQLVQLFCHASALLHPSLCEGFGMPVAEAMACGCPVVTSNQSAMPEVADGAALLADPHDSGALARCLLRVADEPSLAQALREKGLARAERLDWRGFAQATVGIYRRVLAAS